MPQKTRKSSHTELLKLLDSVASVMKNLPLNCMATCGHAATPAENLFETIEFMMPTKWSAWLVTLEQQGMWPLADDKEKKELALAVGCYPGLNAPEFYHALKDTAGRAVLVLSTDGDPGSATKQSVLKANEEMLSLLGENDRKFLQLIASLDAPWYELWDTRGHVVENQGQTSLPTNMNLD